VVPKYGVAQIDLYVHMYVLALKYNYTLSVSTMITGYLWLSAGHDLIMKTMC